jgi:hypothetical protein
LDPLQDRYFSVLRSASAPHENPLIRSSDFARSWSWSLIKAGRLDNAKLIAAEASKVVDHDSDYCLMMARISSADGNETEALRILQAGFSETNQWDVAAKLVLQLLRMGCYVEALDQLRQIQASPSVLHSLRIAFPSSLLAQCVQSGSRPLSMGCELLRLIRVANYSSIFLESIIALVEGGVPEAERLLQLAKTAEPTRADSLSRQFSSVRQLLQRSIYP